MQVRQLRNALITAGAALGMSLAAAAPATAQVSFGVNIGGPAPVCPYGYYGFAPYNCAPYGYYGPEWFNGGAFIGAGPWYHGHGAFYGPVNRRFDPRYGYHGGYPAHGGYHQPADNFHSFHGNAFHGPHGEAAPHGFHGGDDHGGHSDDHGGHH